MMRGTDRADHAEHAVAVVPRVREALQDYGAAFVILVGQFVGAIGRAIASGDAAEATI